MDKETGDLDLPIHDQVEDLYANLEQEEGDVYLWPGREHKRVKRGKFRVGR